MSYAQFSGDIDFVEIRIPCVRYAKNKQLIVGKLTDFTFHQREQNVCNAK